MMALRLHRFPLSHFAEKARALLDFKELDYELIDHQLGLPQLALWQLSGQRKVPVLEHDARVVSDSTAIALYLEEMFPEARQLLPGDVSLRRDVLTLEDRLDRVLGKAAPLAVFDGVVEDRRLLEQFMDLEVWGIGPRAARALSPIVAAASRVGGARRWIERARRSTRQMLVELCDRLRTTPYLIGHEPTLADIAAVGLALPLEFPRSARLGLPELAGWGAAGWFDDPELRRFFDWRAAFYQRYLK
jgi:glutathione S-transferase